MLKTLNIFLILIVLFVGCKDENKNNDEIDSRNEFIGNWLVIEKSTSVGKRNFEVEVNYDPIKNHTINITNFYALGYSDTIDANISTVEMKTIIIPYQEVRNNIINGSGSLHSNVIQMIYYVDDGNIIDTVSATFTRELL